jgi:hypothetical protein
VLSASGNASLMDLGARSTRASAPCVEDSLSTPEEICLSVWDVLKAASSCISGFLGDALAVSS